MKILPVLLLTLLSVTGLHAQWQQKDFKAFQKAVGTWAFERGGTTVRETWIRVNDTLFEGSSYNIKNGVEELQETITLSFSKGSIVLTPTTRNQNDGNPIPFTLISNKKDRFVFENKAHDFPQQIIYHFKGDRQLDAAINGQTPKGFRQVDFPYRKTTK